MAEHDSLFKRAFSVPAHAAGELRSLLPASLTGALDLSMMKMEPASFVDGELAQRHTDLLFSSPFIGRLDLAYFLFEHQSAQDRAMPWRGLTYQHRVWDQLVRAAPGPPTRLPPILTIVVHHGATGWSAPRRFHEMVPTTSELPDIAPFVPNFDLLVDNLVLVDDAALKARPLAPFPKVVLWLLRDGRNVATLLDHLPAWKNELEWVAKTDPSKEDTMTLVRYLWEVAEPEGYSAIRQALTHQAPTLGGTMLAVEKMIFDKGLQDGRREGLEDGRREGLEGIRAMFTRFLVARFGALAPAFEERIRAASKEQLDQWADRVVAAERVEDVFDT